MALHVYAPGNWVPDDGNDREYPIEEKEDNSVIAYDKHVQSMSYITANMVGVFETWFMSFFPEDYFKFVRIKTQSTLTDFKSFMKSIYKKEKPFVVIDPRSPEIADDFLFAQNMLNRYNMVDPQHDNVGAKMIYSLPVMIDDTFELWFRRNRWKIEFDVMIMEESINRQLNVFNHLLMNIRHNSKFTIIRHVPVVIPERHVWNMAKFAGLDADSDAFIEYLNRKSHYPFFKRVLGNGKIMTYMLYEMHLYVEVPSFPAKDSAEMSEAIDLGARVTDAFIFTADLPSEFLFLTKEEHVGKFDRGVEENPEAITFISPYYADMPWPESINDYVLTNKVDIELQEGDEPFLQILDVLAAYDPSVYRVVGEYAEHNLPLKDLVMVRVYPNGSMKNVGSILHDNGMLEITAPKYNKLYTACIYIDLKKVNLIKKGEHTEYVGDLEKY